MNGNLIDLPRSKDSPFLPSCPLRIFSSPFWLARPCTLSISFSKLPGAHARKFQKKKIKKIKLL